MRYGTNTAVLCFALTACTTAPRVDVGTNQLAATVTQPARTAGASGRPALLIEPSGAPMEWAIASEGFDGEADSAPSSPSWVAGAARVESTGASMTTPSGLGLETDAEGLLASPSAEPLRVMVAPGLFQDATKYGPSAGESILDLSAAVTASNDIDNSTTNTSVNLGVGLGVFLTDVIEVGFRTSGTFTIPDQGDSTITAFGSVDLNFNVRMSRRFWLYIGPHFGFTYIEIPGSGTTAGSSATEPSGGGQVGARLWLTPSVSLTLEERLTYSQFTFGNTEIKRLDSLTRIGFTYVF